MVEKFYGIHSRVTSDNNKIVNQTLQGQLEYVRKELFTIMHEVIVNAPSRQPAMDFITQVLRLNEKRAQFQVNEKLVSTDGFMLNLLSVLQMLSQKVKVEKVDILYPFHPKARVVIKKDETRLKMTTNDAEAWTSEVAKADKWQEPKFQTECVYSCAC